MRAAKHLSTCAIWGGVFIGALAPAIAQTSKATVSARGVFFRLTTELLYKGQPVTISYVAGCKPFMSRQFDGDRSVDGAALVPMLWGQRMPDGGAVVVKTPRLCSGQTTENGRVPKDYLPILVHFDRADQPWFGRAYMTREAFSQPASVMAYRQSTILSATPKEWEDWRSKDSHRNVVRYEITELTGDWFQMKKWSPGTRWMPMVCQYANVLPAPRSVKTLLGKFWPTNKPTFWASENAYSEVMRHANRPPGSEGDDVLFDGHRLGEVRQYNRPIYPVRSDFDINQIADLKPEIAELPPSEPLTKANVEHNPEERGFAYCQNFDKPQQIPKMMHGYGVYRYLGTALVDETRQSTGFRSFGFVNDEYFVTFAGFQLHTMGGALR